MADYGDHVRLLVFSLIGLVALFLLASLVRQREFVTQVFWSIIIVVLAILILARFGGDLGRTI